MLKSLPGTGVVSISSGNRTAVIAARNKLVEEHIDLVRPIAAQIARKLPPSFELDDLIAEGYTGLITAAVRYRPQAHGGTPFSAFARKWVRGAILDSVRRKNYVENTRASMEGLEAAAPPTVELAIDKARLSKRLMKAVGELPDRLRVVIDLHYGAGLELVEIAPKLDRSAWSASKYKADALKELRKRLLDRAA